MTNMMRAIRCDEPGRLSLIERPVPEPGPGEVLVRIRHVGVCGTDLHIFEGTQPYFEYPRVIGHELAGEVVDKGPGVGATPEGLVAIVPYLHCGHCIACRQGRTNCCRTLKVLGVHTDGGMADHVVVPATHVLPAAGLAPEGVAMVEFLAIGAHGVRRGAVAAGQRVLVLGAGPIGISAMIFAKARGAEITTVDMRHDRLDFATARLGVDAALDAREDVEAVLRERTGGDFFDVVIDATGNRGSMERAFGYVAHAGSYVMLGIVRDPIAFSDPEFHKRETTLLASRNATLEDFATVLATMRAGQVPVAAIATHRAPLEDAPARFPEWLRPETGVIKAIVDL